MYKASNDLDNWENTAVITAWQSQISIDTANLRQTRNKQAAQKCSLCEVKSMLPPSDNWSTLHCPHCSRCFQAQICLFRHLEKHSRIDRRQYGPLQQQWENNRSAWYFICVNIKVAWSGSLLNEDQLQWASNTLFLARLYSLTDCSWLLTLAQLPTLSVSCPGFTLSQTAWCSSISRSNLPTGITVGLLLECLCFPPLLSFSRVFSCGWNISMSLCNFCYQLSVYP